MSVYKGDNLVAGGRVLPVVRKPAWSQAETIAALPFTAPKDGILLLKVGSGTGTGGRIFYVNGVEVAAFALGSGEQYDFSLQLNAGDILTSDFSIWGTYKFVPFEDSTVSDVEVITPEYIRNQNILSDYEAVTLPTSSASAITIPYDGYITLSYTASAAYGQANVFCIRNGVTVKLFSGANPATQALAGTFPVQKNDKVFVDLTSGGSFYGTQYAQYYKLRDYRGR